MSFLTLAKGAGTRLPSVAPPAGAAQLGLTTAPSSTPVNGTNFAQQPAVQLLDVGGSAFGLGGVVITAALFTGAGTLGGTLTAVTNSSGLATFTNLKITGLVGDRRIRFTSPGLTSVTTGTLTLVASAATTIAAYSATSQIAEVSTDVTAPPSVLITDQSGNPVSGTTVTFAVTAGGGTRSPGTVVSDASGLATLTSWTVGSGVGTNNNTLTATASGLTGSPVTFQASGETAGTPITGYPNLPVGFIHTVGRNYATKAANDADRGIGSFPNKTTGSQGFDGIEYRYGNISIVTDGAAPTSPSTVMEWLYPAQTVSSGTFTPGTSQTLDFQNVAYAGMSVGACKWFYARFAAKWSSNFYGNPTGTNKFTFIRVNGTQGFEPILRLRGVGAGSLILNVDLQGSEGPGGDVRAGTGGLNPNTAGASGAGAFAVPRGSWHQFEWLMNTGTFGNADGQCHIWMNGTKTHDYTDIRFHRTSTATQRYWASWHQDPTWGGGAGTIPADMYMRMDDLQIWLKAA